MTQIEMFELLDDSTPTEKVRENVALELYDIVKVKKIHKEKRGQLDAEDYYYIKEFMNKKGKIVDIKCNSINGTFLQS